MSKQRNVPGVNAVLDDEASKQYNIPGVGAVALEQEGATNATVNVTGVSATAAVGSVTLYLPQVVRPTADISTNGWLSSLGGALHDAVNEAPANDADYIYSPDNPTGQIAEVEFSAGQDPASSTGHIIRLRLQAVALDTNFDLALVQGTTVLDSWTESVTVAAGVVQRERTLSGAVADSITNYADLRLRVGARA